MKQTRRFQMKRNTFKMIVSLLVIWALASFTFAQVSEAQGQQNGHLKRQLDAYFTKQMEDGALSGSVLVAKDGKILLKKGYGMADYVKGKHNTPETIFEMGSMGKAFTAMCIMMLEERGLLNVNDTIDQYLPWFPNGDLITIHQLLNHTSGLYDYVNNPDSQLWQDENYTKFHYPYDLLGYFMYKPLSFEPGSQWSYCNSGFVVLGVIIEELSGMTYGDFLETNIFKPLGMEHTFYDPYEIVFQNKKAIGYDDISTYPPIISPEISDSVVFSAGGIYTTIKDLYKWDQALNTNRLVSYDTLEQIFTPGLEDYGYGWWIQYLEYNGQMHKDIWHGGAYVGFHSFISRFVDDNVTIIILSNTTAPNEDIYNFDLGVMSKDAAGIIFRYQ